MKEAILLTDGYKLAHHKMYPEGIQLVYSNWTPRSNRYFPEAKEGSVVFGIQYLIKEYLIKQFNEGFFNRPKEEVLKEYLNRLSSFTGDTDVKHIEKLYDLGYLPIEIKALPEGTVCPIRVPMLTIKNTHPDFAWVTNYLESLISNVLWMPCTSATTSRLFKKQLYDHASLTGFINDAITLGFACHDFSMRGMAGIEASKISGMAHLISFAGTESVPALSAIEEYYNTDANKELVAATVPATEHSIECSNAIFNEDGSVDEYAYFNRLLDLFPTGIVSIVSDGFDYWNVIENILPNLKERILGRDGRVVIRPDSGNPVDIICGLRTNPQYRTRIYEGKYYCNFNPFNSSSEFEEVSKGQYYGSYYMLGETFGWNTTENGYLYPSTKIGLIYGDAITLERQKQIYDRLVSANMAACNLILGVGSFSMQFRSRDSLGFAIKCTAVKINDQLKPIFKKPKTDDGTKNSLKGLITVLNKDNTYVAVDEVSEEQEQCGVLQTVFKDGKLIKEFTLQEIRNNINDTLCKH